MAEKTMKDAVDMEDYQRWDKGLPPKKEKAPAMKEPEPPQVADILTLAKLKLQEVVALPRGRHRGIRNKEGIMFMGFDVTIQLKDGKKVSGWMPTADFHEMRRTLFRIGTVPMQNVEF